MIKFTSGGSFVLQIGTPGQSEGPDSTTTLSRPSALALDESANEVYVADTGNRRIIVFDGVYDTFKAMLVDAANKLKVGIGDTDDYGPVINEEQLRNMLSAVGRAKETGAVVLTGGERLTGGTYGNGYFMAPTIVEHVGPNDEITRSELFGPITCLYRVKNFEEAIALANDSPFGLTAAIHTQNINRAMTFLNRIQSGVAVVNGGTYGSEPHLPFGGLRQSGNGWREAGTQAIDVYSDLKTIYINHNPANV